MNSQTEKKQNSQRPGSSIRDYDDEISDLENSEKRSKLSKLPKRTYSLEGKENTFSSRRSNNSHQSSTTSMIPRPERKKFTRNISSRGSYEKEFRQNNKKNDRIKHPQSANNARDEQNVTYNKTKESPSQTVVKLNVFETKLEEDFVQLKNNILKIPEFWSDADQTVKNILKNAVSIFTKQYPTADAEAIEAEIQNILKATAAVKQEILTKTEDIVNQANKIYGEGYEGLGPTDEELKLIAEKMEELRKNVNAKTNFGDLFKYGPDTKQIGDFENTLKQDGKQVKDVTKILRKDVTEEEKRTDTRKIQKRLGSKKSKLRMGSDEQGMNQSCGDILRQDAKAVIRLINDSVVKTPRDSNLEDKSCQTMSLWASEIVKREESLKMLNNQIMELHNLCKDHITKFKSFNFQIKFRGMCKAQNLVSARDAPTSAKNKLSLYNKEYDYESKRQDVDLHQKNRLMSQQKKLLHARDELIEMLKTRCNIEVEEI